MYDITILAIGKVKEKYLSEAIDEYLKRLKPYARVVVQELTFESFREGQAKQASKIEGERILKFLDTKNNALVIALDEHGESLTSEQFSDFLEKPASFIFIVGGTAGLSPAVLSRADYKIALSAMTFTHEMARLFLCEQLYRAVTIQKGKSYHY